MLINIHHDSPAEHRRLLVAGVVFLTSIALLVWLCIAVYLKVFEPTTTVVLEAERAGLQLTKFGDVRVNGALVGQVRGIDQDGEKALITLGLRPEAAEEIPEDVRAEILPTTLFGQKYVALVIPRDASDTAIQDGDVVPADRVRTNVELDRILGDLFPLLRSVRPADLNATLNALSTALEGRGDQAGETLDELGGYLDEISGSLPTLRRNLALLADVADVYDDAAPDLIDVLGNLTVTSKTVIEKQQDLETFFSDVQGLADVSTRVLEDNRNDLIAVGQVTAPVLKLLAVYSPQLPCLLRGATRYDPLLSRSFEGNEVKQYVELGAAQYRAYDERDLPEYGEVGRGPWCLGLPDPPVPIPPQPLRDGSDQDSRPPSSKLPGSASGVSSGYAGTAGDRAVVNALLAGRSGRSADRYGSLGSLFYGPVVRGSATEGGGAR
ncbi:mce related protein [Nocardioides dokdonensis FR1436]|uniref:Mce related protein n=1 Tax=Nocardioides dokdonensis FR1436 TaxID=1300347 RepID=A0A1A9GNP6_9ACTN|nr:MCE family protein [Nocardioides dokdonensis]ANH39914.1 mce related protein [Nocardioides dokdonensis FR1436]